MRPPQAGYMYRSQIMSRLHPGRGARSLRDGERKTWGLVASSACIEIGRVSLWLASNTGVQGLGRRRDELPNLTPGF
jgi:hypothetical protein